MQVDPIKPTLKAPGAKRLKLKYEEPLSKIAYNLRRYTLAVPGTPPREGGAAAVPRSGPTPGQGLTLVPISAQPQPCLTQRHTLNTLEHPFTPPKHPLDNPSAHPLCQKKSSR